MFHHLNLSIRFPGITKNYELYTFEWYEKRGSLQFGLNFSVSEKSISSRKQFKSGKNCTSPANDKR